MRTYIYIYIYIYAYAYLCIFIYTCMCVYVCVCVCAHVEHTYTHTPIQTHINIRTRTCLSTHTRTHSYAHAHICTHSCDPNCMMDIVRIGASAHPVAALFSIRDITEQEELTWNYGSVGGGAKQTVDIGEHVAGVRRTPCTCGAVACCGVLPFESSL